MEGPAKRDCREGEARRLVRLGLPTLPSFTNDAGELFVRVPNL